ncbi:hypothetical protein [Chitinimonas sp.]|uniref:hypothetical protein n=1 Tax=Chitinimonas sp. TaxID=1934313 RepID=UPI0035AD7F86
MEAQLIAVMALLHERDGVSVHLVCKRLGLRLSQLNRLLAVLATPVDAGGLDWVRQHDDGRRCCLYLTDTGRQLCLQD